MQSSRIPFKRKKMRLNDYPVSACYFITICSAERKKLFGEIAEQKMYLSDYGKIAFEEWSIISQRFINANSDIIQIMPDHLHAIIFLDGPVHFISEEQSKPVEKISPSEKEIIPEQKNGYPIPDISKIIGAYKSNVSNKSLKLFKEINKHRCPEPILGKIWQRSFWERIIRDERELQNVREYIKNNPANWTPKKFNQIQR